jgi:prepilin-type N-terminal cleavage/methylation domain-containing protein
LTLEDVTIEEVPPGFEWVTFTGTPPWRTGPQGFTLIELLVVIVIIVIVSAVALPTVLSAMSHRQVSEAARILQASLAGARDAAIRDNSPHGIRLLPDPVTPGAVNRIIPLSQPPAYSEGLVSILPAAVYDPVAVLLGTQALVLEEATTIVVSGITLPSNPTSWFWNVRVGDKIQINQVGPWLTVCGPIVTANPEGFVNCGLPGTVSPLGHDYLLLANGYDDNQNGWIDEGWDGVDNDGDTLIDETTCASFPAHGEWEQETWRGAHTAGLVGGTYLVRRRPIPGSGAKAIDLPSNVVIDMGRSNLPVVLDLVCSPTGQWSPSLPYGVPSSISMGGSWLQFWLAERADVGTKTATGSWYLVSVNGQSGKASSFEAPDLVAGLVAARQQ